MSRNRVLSTFTAAAIGFLGAASLAQAQGETFVPTGSLTEGGRWFHRAVALPDGKVLEVGGFKDSGADNRATAELYDPATGTFHLAGTMAEGRGYHTATLIPGGRVLVAGGGRTGTIFSSTEIWNPATETFEAGPTMTTPRFAHVAVALADGRVLVSGGDDRASTPVAIGSAEILDPVSGTSTVTGSMIHRRQVHCGVLLADGRVLVAGGDLAYDGFTSTVTCETWDPATGTWTAAASMSDGRGFFAMARLNDGRVLAVGGDPNTPTGYIHSTEIYDPATNTWTSAGTVASGGQASTLVVLTDGRALSAGGYDGQAISAADIFDPATGTWSALPAMTAARYAGAAAPLLDGGALIAGGFDPSQAAPDLDSAERFVAFHPIVNHPPVANAGADFTAEATGPGGATVTLNGSASSDPDGNALTFTWSGPFGTAGGASPSVSLAIGVHTVTLTVDDGHGETHSDSVIVTVQDSTKPTITSATPNPAVLWPPNHKMIPVSIAVVASDVVTPALVCQILSVTSNEPVAGAPDWEVTGALTLKLRAERLGNGTGRIYSVTVQCTDAAGNASTKVVQVTVPHNQ